jgi:hypothetical protein
VRLNEKQKRRKDFVDKTGQKFDKLTVLSIDDTRIGKRRNRIRWKCLCDCGNITTTESRNLSLDKKTSCGIGACNSSIVDRVGKKFGCLTVVSFNKTERDNSGYCRGYWNCKCDCGNLLVKNSLSLENYANINCNSKTCNKRKLRHLDKVGSVFGKLTVISYNRTDTLSENKKRSSFWNCKCFCGKELIVSNTDLVSGNKISCGCIRYKRLGIKKKSDLEISNTQIYCKYKNSADIRLIDFKLSKEDVSGLYTKKCHYCNATPSNVLKFRDTCMLYNGIDRVNSNKGYTVDNCVPCCKVCNTMKMELKLEEFFNHIARIYKYNIEGKNDQKKA